MCLCVRVQPPSGVNRFQHQPLSGGRQVAGAPGGHPDTGADVMSAVRPALIDLRRQQRV